MAKYFFVNENQLQDWVSAAEDIRDNYGITKALGYLIGEKFSKVLQAGDSYRSTLKSIEQERQQPNYDPIRTYSLGKFGQSVENLDESYEKNLKRVAEEPEVLSEFVRLIWGAFARHEINGYLDSHPRLGPLGHVMSQEKHAFMVEKGAVNWSVETEVEDALLFARIRECFERE